MRRKEFRARAKKTLPQEAVHVASKLFIRSWKFCADSSIPLCYFLSFFFSLVRIPPPYSETVRTRVSLHITNNSFCLCSSTLRIFDEFLSQRLAVVVVSFSWNWRNWKFYASKRVREGRKISRGK